MTRQRSLTRGEQNAALLIIDVRGPDEFTGPLGHIAGATNLPLNELPDRTPDLVRDDRPMVLVYNTDRRSSIAARRLLEAGVSEVSVLRGGMEQWRGARLAGFVTTPPRIGAIIAFFRSVHVLNRCHIRELAECNLIAVGYVGHVAGDWIIEAYCVGVLGHQLHDQRHDK